MCVISTFSTMPFDSNSETLWEKCNDGWFVSACVTPVMYVHVCMNLSFSSLGIPLPLCHTFFLSVDLLLLLFSFFPYLLITPLLFFFPLFIPSVYAYMP